MKIGLISLADNEDAMCDRAIRAAQHFESLKVLDVGKSDAIDNGMECLSKLKALKSCNCFYTSIKGSCFKYLPLIPGLENLNASFCQIEEKNLDYLERCHKLKTLYLSHTGTGWRGVRSIGMCTKLTELRLSGNEKVGDESMQYLVHLSELRFLDLTATRVTSTGLRQLRGIKLKKLLLPRYEQNEQTAIKSIFPKVVIIFDRPLNVTREIRRIYAPTIPDRIFKQ